MPLDFDMVETTLLAWEAVLCNGKTVVTGDVVDIWLAILQDEAVTESEFRRAGVKVAKVSKFGLPKPADLLDAVAVIRGVDRAAALPRFVMAKDAAGNELPRPVPADQVDEHGRWMAPGAPCLPPPPKALPAFTSATLAPETIRDQMRRMSPIARRAFITLIRLEGGDASTEIEAVRAIEAEERTASEAEANRRDADHASRVRDQAAAMRGAHARNTTPE